MKVSDLIAEFLSRHVRHVFCVSGGADLHLIHSIAKQEGITYVCPNSEQAASFAADAYARLNGLGVALATSGPGASNLITGIATSYYDSVPTLYICGNQTVARMETFGTRQYGFQSTPIKEMAYWITKRAVTITQPHLVGGALEEAVRIAKSGRPGPVLLDLPDDVQRANV